jgi:hypothetical protein
MHRNSIRKGEKMAKRRIPFAIFLIVLFPTFFVFHSPAQSVWSPDPAINSPITTADGDQWNPKIVSDGVNGAIIAWPDRNYGRIQAQRINAVGNVLWAVNGVDISTYGDDGQPNIVSDGAGGAIIAWVTADEGVFAQRVDAGGNLRWGADGVTLSTIGNSLYAAPVLASDGAGGAIIAWSDGRNAMYYGLYAQRVDADGNKLWASDADVPARTQSRLFQPKIASDGAHGAIIAWEDERNGASNVDLYAQRLNANGATQWASGGVAVCNAANLQMAIQMIAEGIGGAIITWQDRRSTSWGVSYAQKFDGNGNAQWTPNGVAVCTESNYQSNPLLTGDGNGGAIIAWVDNRNPHPYVYAQRLDSAGNRLWSASGVEISNGTFNQGGGQDMTGDGNGNAIIAWLDYSRIGFYAQRVNASGNTLWMANGMPITTAIYSGGIRLAQSGGGAIATWYDSRNDATTGDDIYAQKIFPNGKLSGSVIGDYSGDAKTDVSAFHHATDQFFEYAAGNLGQYGWGGADCYPLVWDYDGDGVTDVSIYHIPTNQWFVRGVPGDNLGAFGWGSDEAVPVPGDYNGDGTVDRAFYHWPTNRWFVEQAGGSFTDYAFGWGGADCIPIAADYDGDGTIDMMLYHVPTNQWFMFGAGDLGQFGWNGSECIPVPGDWDGDGRTEIGIYHWPSNQWFWRNEDGTVHFLGQYGWGGTQSFPIPGDYDGDGVMERAFYRPAENWWFIEGESDFVWGYGGSEFMPITSQMAIYNWFRFGLGKFQ